MRRWLIVAVAVPLAAWALDRVADGIALRYGEGRITRMLRRPRGYRLARKGR
jgi:hypothetical protein